MYNSSINAPRDKVVVADVAAPPLTISLTRGTSAHEGRSQKFVVTLILAAEARHLVKFSCY